MYLCYVVPPKSNSFCDGQTRGGIHGLISLYMMKLESHELCLDCPDTDSRLPGISVDPISTGLTQEELYLGLVSVFVHVDHHTSLEAC